VPAQQNQTETPHNQEKPIIEGNVKRKIPHVVQLEQVMIHDPLDQIEPAPAQEQLAGKGAGGRQQGAPFGVPQEQYTPTIVSSQTPA